MHKVLYEKWVNLLSLCRVALTSQHPVQLRSKWFRVWLMVCFNATSGKLWCSPDDTSRPACSLNVCKRGVRAGDMKMPWKWSVQPRLCAFLVQLSFTHFAADLLILLVWTETPKTRLTCHSLFLGHVITFFIFYHISTCFHENRPPKAANTDKVMGPKMQPWGTHAYLMVSSRQYFYFYFFTEVLSGTF